MAQQPPRSQQLNIQAVADAAGVSKTTVSHVLSGNRPVSAATQRKVRRVMEELGFQPNFFAQALNSSRSHSIALLVQDLTNPFYPALARGLQTAVASAEYVLMMFDAGAEEGLIDAFVRDVIQRRVDGVVVAVSEIDPHLEALRAAGIPVVAVGSSLSGLPLDWVSADDEAIGFAAVEYLVKQGHRRIGTISGPPGQEPGRGRLRGYHRAVAEFGLSVTDESCEAGNFTREGGAAAMGRLLALAEPPSAVFCANDLMAIGALDVAHERGLRIPEDIAVIGVDDIEAADLVRPSLTTIRIPAQEIGKVAGELLQQRMSQEPDAVDLVRHVLLQHTLVQRHSA